MRSRLLLSAIVALRTWCPPVTSQSIECIASKSSTCAITTWLDNATVIGVTDGTTASYLGIPFAQPPVGALRLNLPEPVKPYTGLLNATTFGNQCYNTLHADSVTLPPWITPEMLQYFSIFDNLATSPFDEDCLNLNVIAPANISVGRRLPVIAYIFFGAFKFGGSADVDGRMIVQRSMEIGEPVLFVSMNHRLGPYGFLGGKEVKAAGIGNLGLQDQREALRWIQKYIHTFGGDSRRVTLLGLSSGAVSAALQMVANEANTEGLFHAVWAESGAVQPLGWIDQPGPQGDYDTLVSRLNCTGAADTLACIRASPVDAITEAGDMDLNWQPHADGSFFKDLPQLAMVRGDRKSNAEDEGTVFTLGFPNVTTDAQLEELVRTNYFANISDSDMGRLLKLYPNDPAKGAPYGTGDQFQFAPMLKRIASLTGDAGVVAIRRLFTESLAVTQDVWTYIYRRNQVPGWGSTHGSEIPNMYGGGDLTDLLIHFANTHDPNGPSPKPYWPQYDLTTRKMLDFYGNDSLRVSTDTYRKEAVQFVIELGLEHPWPV